MSILFWYAFDVITFSSSFYIGLNMSHISSPPMSAFERAEINEESLVQDLVARLKQRITHDNSKRNMRRDAHAKMHGLVKAEFTVLADLPSHLRVGLFREPKTYHAWIRYSNQDSSLNPDINADIRGMAIKLMGVHGEKILDEAKTASTHDFVLISTPIFVTKDVGEFDAMIKAMGGNIVAKAWFFLSHWRILMNLRSAMKSFSNLLQTQFFSATPYLFGDRAVKYSARPHLPRQEALPDKPSDDFLRERLVRDLKQNDMVFDFCVQFQVDKDAMPIEDPGVLWDESVSPFQAVARIKIFRQEFDSEAQRAYGDNLSFSPWHALPSHRPLGSVNRARKIVYRAISLFRHESNQTARFEPNDWDF